MKQDAACALVIEPSLGRYVILTVGSKFGGYTLPGGKVESGESSKLACVRELLEETDLRTVPAHLALVGEGPSGVDGDRLVCVYHVAHVSGSPRDTEGRGLKWLTFPELLQASPFRDFYQRIMPDGIHHLIPTAW